MFLEIAVTGLQNWSRSNLSGAWPAQKERFLESGVLSAGHKAGL
jgi:hypothetical protein